MAIHQSGNDAPVDHAFVAGVLGLGHEMSHGFVAIPVALDIKAIGIVAAAAPAIGSSIEILVLERDGGHRLYPSRRRKICLFSDYFKNDNGLTAVFDWHGAQAFDGEIAMDFHIGFGTNQETVWARQRLQA